MILKPLAMIYEYSKTCSAFQVVTNKVLPSIHRLRRIISSDQQHQQGTEKPNVTKSK